MVGGVLKISMQLMFPRNTCNIPFFTHFVASIYCKRTRKMPKAITAAVSAAVSSRHECCSLSPIIAVTGAATIAMMDAALSADVMCGYRCGYKCC
jgi:hypothetical protein